MGPLFSSLCGFAEEPYRWILEYSCAGILRRSGEAILGVPPPRIDKKATLRSRADAEQTNNKQTNVSKQSCSRDAI